jgi:hypothetical protein
VTRRAGVTVRDAPAEALMVPDGIAVLLVVGQDGAQMRPVQDGIRSKGSRRRVPIRRSQIAFIRAPARRCAGSRCKRPGKRRRGSG